MKKFVRSIFILFCLQFAPAKAQWVTIPDANFVSKLTQLYPSCMNGNQMDTTCAGILSTINLSIFNLNISDISGIQYFKSLKSLHSPNNQISSINELPDSLEILNLSNNQIVSLPQLPNNLSQLIVHHNSLTTLPPLPVHLEMLNCGSNSITMLPMLSDSLKYLYCGVNQIVSLPLLPDGLIVLDCSSNLINNLPTLPDSLTTLYCNTNLLTSLPQLPENLKHLSCAHNQITNIPMVSNNMFTFYVFDNNITCINNLPFVGPSSSSGNISNNPLTCVPNQTNYSLGLPLCIDNDPINNPVNCNGVANITGYVYKDLDTNCSYSNTDWHTQNIPVKVYDSQNNILAMSYTVNGAYSFTLLQPDTFVVKIDDVNLPISMDCGQVNNQSVVLDSANQTIQNINFPVVCDTAYDIFIQSATTQGWVFPGQTHTLKTNISSNEDWYNLDCSSNYSGTVSINITGPITYVSPANGAITPTVNGNTFTYNITNFNTLSPNSFGLNFLTDTTAQAGDQTCVHVEIDPTPLDFDTTNNVYDFCYNVVNSYDPNFKEVYPINVLPGYDDWFTYTVHFQNTGNAPAFNIRLRDTLDTNLDVNTFEVRGYSHPAIISINGNVLTVRFNNIMLPDSTTNYEGSIGYFQYRIKPLSNIVNGSQIRNTAYIYFDYNAPIVTNTTTNNFDMTVPVANLLSTENGYLLYPNPSAGIFTFKDSKNIKIIEVFNLMGELILSQGNAKQINLQGFPQGIYVAKINGQFVSKLVKE